MSRRLGTSVQARGAAEFYRAGRPHGPRGCLDARRPAVAQSHGQGYPACVVVSVQTAGCGAATDAPRVAEGIEKLVELAERSLALRRVYLFGSRARGDAHRFSDVDLAFEHDSSPAQWARFVNTAQDECPLLLDLDLVDLAEATAALRERILREGKILHG